MRAVVEALQALRGVAKLTAVTIATEVGTFRERSPSHLHVAGRRLAPILGRWRSRRTSPSLTQSAIVDLHYRLACAPSRLKRMAEKMASAIAASVKPSR
jgi:hypothetical protein